MLIRRLKRGTLAALGSLIMVDASAAGETPRKDGLVLWLDASDTGSMVINDEGRLTGWKDKSGEGHVAGSKRGPELISEGLGGHDVLRFDDKSSLDIPGAIKGHHQATVFIAFKRDAAQSNGGKWQKVITSGEDKNGVFLHTGVKTEALSPRVLRASFEGIKGSDLHIGKGGPNGKPTLHGDIAEILIYDRDFYVEAQMREIVSYLEKKWDFVEDRESDWTHVGPLPETPKRVTTRLPLSDQTNEGKWTPNPAFSDEFEGSELDDSKWWDHNPNWYGRAPGRFLARDVEVADGELRLTMQFDESLPPEDFYRNGKKYHDYSSGTISSKTELVYGYYEIEAKPMASSGSSAWWFTGRSFDKQDKGDRGLEIDVFELGGKSPGREKTYSMNLHVFKTPESNQHWNRGGEWEAPFRFIDDFHVFGLEWTPDAIRYYVDGTMVRSVKNSDWHAPMRMIFDSETMFDWLGVPETTDLPSVFRVRYVRAWTNDATSSDWQKRYQVKKSGAASRITRYVREMDKKEE